jgi:hypothetical protein
MPATVTSRLIRGVDLTFASHRPRLRQANVQSKTPLESHIYRCNDANFGLGTPDLPTGVMIGRRGVFPIDMVFGCRSAARAAEAARWRWRTTKVLIDCSGSIRHNRRAAG